MGACFDRLRCEVFQNLFLNPMNTGFVRPAVATVLTACGIETFLSISDLNNQYASCNSTYRLRYWNLPPLYIPLYINHVATVLPACGIETITAVNSYRHVQFCCNSTYRLRYWNCHDDYHNCCCDLFFVATVLTACGIETLAINRYCYLLTWMGCNSTYRLRYWNYLTFNILLIDLFDSCNSTYRLRYWNWFEASSEWMGL